jgi:segregation and condensation protein B
VFIKSQLPAAFKSCLADHLATYKDSDCCYSNPMEIDRLKTILEAAILVAGEPINLERLSGLFDKTSQPEKSLLKQALVELEADYLTRGIRLKRVASGYCFYTPPELSEWVKGLWPEKKLRYSRAFLETLAIIAYKQPVTRGDIEAIRGVSVNPNIIKILLDQEWVHAIGQREVPGKPTLYATTKQFLDHFNLQQLSELPPFPAPAAIAECANDSTEKNVA